MHKILVIDDNKTRNKRIVSSLKAEFSSVEIHSAFNVNDAKTKLRNNFYFALFLDMALPLRDSDNFIDENSGIKLLESISRGRFKKIPNRVIGFTALVENFSDKEERFDTLGFKLFESKSGDFSWLSKAIRQVKYTLDSINSFDKLPSDLAVLSVHGIETDGKWQENLHSFIVDKYPNIEISNLSFKFEKFPMIRFFLPFLRKKMVNKFYCEINQWLKENKTKRIICFSHSFGTYILIKALEKIEKTYIQNLDLVVLSGSVLEQNYDFAKIKEIPNIRIVNECAKQDVALLFSKAAVLGTGMGGRLGFNGLMDNKFINRSYDGGHSVFFENNYEILKNQWIPLIEIDADLKPLKNNLLVRKRDSFFEYSARISAKIKFIYYVIVLAIPLALLITATYLLYGYI